MTTMTSILIPSVTISISIEVNNDGLLRVVRMNGPRGSSAFVPHRSDDHQEMIDFIQNRIESELKIALTNLDQVSRHKYGR